MTSLRNKKKKDSTLNLSTQCLYILVEYFQFLKYLEGGGKMDAEKTTKYRIFSFRRKRELFKT